MKNKRIIAAILAVLAVILTVAAIALLRPTPANLVRRMVNKWKKVRSATTEVTVQFEGTASATLLGIPVTLPVTLGMDFETETVLQPMVSHAEGTISGTLFGFGVDVPTECYIREEDGEYVSYISTDHKTWVRKKQENTGDLSLQIDRKTGFALARMIVSGKIKAELAKEPEEVCGKEAYKISADISGEILQLVLEAADASSEQTLDLPEGLDISRDDAHIDLYIYKKDNLPAKIRIDCAELGNSVIAAQLEDNGNEVSVTTEKFEIVVVFKEYNTTESIEIPQEVISGAVESGEGILQNLVPGM